MSSRKCWRQPQPPAWGPAGQEVPMSSKFELRPESPLVAPSAYPTISRSLDSRVHDLSATPTINTTARATLDRHHLVSPACHFSKGQLVGHYVTVGTWLCPGEDASPDPPEHGPGFHLHGHQAGCIPFPFSGMERLKLMLPECWVLKSFRVQGRVQVQRGLSLNPTPGS